MASPGLLSYEQIVSLKAHVAHLAEEYVAYNEEPIRLERPWQYDLVASTNMYEVWGKSRQIGFSWALALRSLIRAHIFPPNTYNAVFVSINKEEAKEKIRYVQAMYDGMAPNRRKQLIGSALDKLVFSNGNSIKSYPAKAVRGAANVDLMLDEFAHIREAAKIYEGSTGSTIRGSYGVTIGSTPFGRGPFKDLFKGAGRHNEYRNYIAQAVPWWESEFLSTDPIEAVMRAPGMRTEERVREFGTRRLIEEYESQMLEVFQQEFENFFFDSANSVLTEDQIMGVKDVNINCPHPEYDCSDEKVIENIEDDLHEIIQQIKATGITECYLGMDVGKEINATEIILLDHRGPLLQTVLYLTLRKCPWQVQERVFHILMDKLPIRKAVLDATGNGRRLSQDFIKIYGSTRVDGLVFSVPIKEGLVGGLIKVFDEQSIRIYPTRRLFTQLLSVKKVYSESGAVLYRAAQTRDDKETKAHADQFWALSMAIYAVYHYERTKITITRQSPILVPNGHSSRSILQPISNGRGPRG